MTDTTDAITIATLAERPDLRDAAQAISDASWPVFMTKDDVANRLWNRLMTDFAAFQCCLLGPNDTMLAYCNSIPILWSGEDADLPEQGWDWAFENGVETCDRGATPNTLSAIGIQIVPARRGQGLSALAVGALRDVAARHGFGALVAPVRPNLKHAYPLTSIDRYVTWTKADSAPFDPWLRVHWRLGARIVRSCHESMKMLGTVAEWEQWTGMAFPETGRYVVPAALEPIEIDREADVGRYVEPNVWMIHSVGGSA